MDALENSKFVAFDLFPSAFPSLLDKAAIDLRNDFLKEPN